MDGTLADIKNSQMNTTRWKRNISCHCGVFVKYKKRYTESMMTDLQTVDSKKEKKHFTLFVCTVEIVISGFKNLAIFCLLFNFRLQKKTSTSEHRSIKVRLLPARANALYMSANRLSFLCAWVFLSGHLQDDKTWGKRKQRGSRKISALMTSVRTRASSYIFRTNEMSLYSPCTPANWMVSTLFSSLSLLPIHLLKTDHLNTKELLLSRWLTLSLGWRNYLRLSFHFDDTS